MQTRTAKMQEPAVDTPAGEKPPAPQKQSKAKVFGMIGVGFAVLAVIGVVWWMIAAGHEETDDAYVDGHISIVSSRVSGTVAKVFVDDNQLVKTGEVLVSLDPRDNQVAVDQLNATLSQTEYQAAAAHAKIGQSSLSAQGQTAQASGDVVTMQADIESSRAALQQAEAQERQAKAKITELDAQVNYAKSDFKRYEYAFKNKAVTQQQYDHARQNIDVAEAQLQEGNDSLAMANRQVMHAQSQIAESTGKLKKSEGMVTSAKAATQQEQIDRSQYASSMSDVSRTKSQLEQAMLNLSYCKIVAPIDGRIGRKSVEVGQRVEPGQALMSVVQPDMWITANYKETQLGQMKIGQPVEVTIDSFPGKKFEGRVDSFSPASGAKFSMLPPDNATGNFTKVVQRVPIKITFKRESLGDYANRLAPGMSCETSVLVKK